MFDIIRSHHGEYSKKFSIQKKTDGAFRSPLKNRAVPPTTIHAVLSPTLIPSSVNGLIN